MEVNYSFPTAEEIFGDSVQDYHGRWNDWKSNLLLSSSEHKDIVQCAREDQITVGEIYIDGTHDAKEVGLRRGNVIVSRAKVNQKNLRRDVNPYRFGKEKQYVYPFWHRSHLWQVIEHLGHGTRNKWCINNNVENNELIMTLDGPSWVKDHIYFKEDISAEMIWHNFGKHRKINGYFLRPEYMTFAIYGEDNKALAGMHMRCFTRIREWKLLAKKISEGDDSAKSPLIHALKSQRIRLDRIGRKSPAHLGDLIRSVEEENIDPILFEDFFSMWDLDDSILLSKTQ